MNKLLLGVAASTLLIATQAYAADPILPPPVDVAPVADAAFWGTVEIGGLARYTSEYGESDLEDETTLGGLYGSFALWGDLGTVRLGLDGYGEWVSFDDVAEDNTLTPEGLGVIGAHAGVALDSAYVGIFGAVGTYPDEDNEDFQAGYAVGVEGTVDAGVATLFGKLGYAFAPSDEYEADDQEEGFDGLFAEVGAIYSISDDLAVMANVGFGYSASFDDEVDEDGGYVNWGAKASYRLPTDFNLNLVASYEGYYAYTVEEEDENLEHTFKLGLSIPFGSTGTAADALNPLSSPVAPFRAGYSSDAL